MVLTSSLGASLLLSLSLALLSTTTSCVSAHPSLSDFSQPLHRRSPSPSPSSSPSTLQKRQYLTSPSDLKPSYDYIIAGGGLAGLVLASRLSEDKDVSVLVLEAGKSGDEVKDRVDSPAGAYYQSIVGTEYDWNFTTVPQKNLANRVIGQPRGRILGGSTAMNAMYLVRPSKTEMDAWATLLSSSNGGSDSTASRWGWDNLYKYMKKAETFHAPLDSLSSVVNITVDASLHGDSGPMQLGYPGVMVNITTNWTAACEGAGMPELKTPNGGVTLGGFITPSSINPANWTRSYSRPAYIDSLPPRSNLHILSEATVLRVTFRDAKDAKGDLVAEGVEWARDSSDERKMVRVDREVVLAAGALSTPKILMMSGVGPKDVLDAAGVGVKLELPGVGQRLQDHMTSPVTWQSNYETAGDIHNSNTDFAKSKEFLSVINDAVAFANASLLFEGNHTAFQNDVKASLNDSTVDALVPSSYKEVKDGYRKIYDLIAGTFWENAAQVELLMSVISPGTVSVQAAMQHPYSVGRVYVNSSNVWDGLVIDPQFHSHWADRVMMRQGLKLVRRVGAAYGAVLGNEVSPGAERQSDDALDAYLVNDPGSGANSQFHPTGTAAMLPKSLGGVVDADTRVYGLANVRVVDGSVFPFEFAAHLASAGYGVAEQAADLIKAETYSVSSGKHTSGAVQSVVRASSLSLSVGAVVVGLFVGLV